MIPKLCVAFSFFLLKILKFSFSKLSKFSVSNCQYFLYKLSNFPFQTVKFSFSKLSKYSFLNCLKKNWLMCREICTFGLVCRSSKSLGNTGINANETTGVFPVEKSIKVKETRSFYSHVFKRNNFFQSTIWDEIVFPSFFPFFHWNWVCMKLFKYLEYWMTVSRKSLNEGMVI